MQTSAVLLPHLQEVVVLVKVMLERGLVLDAMHHVVCVDEKPRKLGRPIVGELVWHATVHGLHFAGKLVVVMSL